MRGQFEFAPRAETVVLGGASQDRLKGSDDRGVELSFDGLGKPEARNSAWHGIAVGRSDVIAL